MYTALEDITIDKIDFDWIQNTTKISHLLLPDTLAIGLLH